MNNRAPGRDRFHRLYYLAALAFIFGWAAYARFRLPPWPFADPDTLGYLQPAVSKLSGGSFVQVNGRNFLYPGFLLLILWTGCSFAAITVVQHLIGLATGSLLLTCWKQTPAFIRYCSIPVHNALGIGLVALYLLARHPIEYEHQLRPEAITPFFAILNILLTLLFFKYNRNKPALVLAAAVLINSVVLVTLKSSFGLSVLFSVIPVLIILGRRSTSKVQFAAIIAVGIAAVLLMSTLENRFGRNDPQTRGFVPVSMFAIHANLIVRQMDQDIVHGRCGDYDCKWLREVNAALHDEIDGASIAATNSYPSLGFNPDNLLYNGLPQRWTAEFFNNQPDKLVRFCGYYYCRTLVHHPNWISGKILRQLGIFYLGHKHSYVMSTSAPLSSLYRDSVAALQNANLQLAWQPLADYLQQCKILSATSQRLSQPFVVRIFAGFLTTIYPLVFLVCVATTAFLLRKQNSFNCTFGFTTLFLFSYNFGNCLGTAIVHSLEVNRYILAQYSFALLAECVGLLFLYEMATGGVRDAANAQAG